MVSAFFPEQFAALRALHCGGERAFVESLGCSESWAPSGGKSGASFARTSDGRFVLKALSARELQGALSLLPAYFEHMARVHFEALPSRLDGGGGGGVAPASRASSFGLLVMENVFAGHRVRRTFDLKGAQRAAAASEAEGEEDATEASRTFHDEELLRFTHQLPLFLEDGAKRLLAQCVWNDTLFLAKNNVMDYSLLLGLADRETADDIPDGGGCVLVVGVIDYVRQYTVDKLAETVVKTLYDPSHQPTVIEPALYKARFREAMDRYFMAVPSEYEHAPWAAVRRLASP
ncbi:hypothetical protein T492DRAFT_631851 [Pavlovales sp. CCMP2436]|nr:hypothetical protein T492DRAFT_631851 [Pavlovales sp. CCMP2436]